MEKKTVLAIVLSTIVLFGFQALNQYLNPISENKTEIINVDNTKSSVIIKETNTPVITLEKEEDQKAAELVKFTTDLFDVTFNTQGANIKSLKLINHTIDVSHDEKVDIVNNDIDDNSLFNIKLGDYNNEVFNEVFSYSKLDEYTFQFSKIFTVKDNSGTDSAPLTLKFKKLDRREDYRKLSVFTNDKRKELKVKSQEVNFSEEYKWTAIEGKFFTVAVIPENVTPTIHYTNELSNAIPQSNLSLDRISLNSSVIEDTYKIYIGPKDKTILNKYNSSETNGWNLSDININKIISFWFLGMFFMWVITIMNSVINNYGISIIVLTVLIKIILYPFTKSSIESMGKMQTIQPEIKILQDKYKNDSAKLNAAMADLYKKEGVNPLGGCLPMLLQMPIFITFTQNNQTGGAAQGASAMQTKMLTLGMPIMFFFIMYNQSSGLLLYWITQNLISSYQNISSKKKSDKAHELVLEEKIIKKKKKKRK